jgi:hypothetical protein
VPSDVAGNWQQAMADSGQLRSKNFAGHASGVPLPFGSHHWENEFPHWIPEWK